MTSRPPVSAPELLRGLGGVAPVILETLSKALERLRGSTDSTVLRVEQNVTFAIPHADRLDVLDHGRIAWEGPPDRFEREAAADYP